MLNSLSIQIILLVLLVSPSFAATGFLDTPDTCLTLQKVNGPTVYLESIGGCDGKPGRVFVDANPGEVRELFVDGRSLGRQTVKSLEIADVTGVLGQAAKIEKEIKLTDNPHMATMMGKAEETKAVYESAEFQEKLREEQNRVKMATIGDQFNSYYGDAGKDSNNASGHLAEDERIYIFVSASMPMHVLRAYAADAAHLGDNRVTLVLRGFVGGMNKIVPTANMIAEMLKKNPSCELSATHKCDMQSVEVMVDPLLYRRYGVQQVPTFVYVKGVNPTNPGMSEGDTDNARQTGEILSLAGDVSLKYVVARFFEEAGGDSLKGMANKLR